VFTGGIRTEYVMGRYGKSAECYKP